MHLALGDDFLPSRHRVGLHPWLAILQRLGKAVEAAFARRIPEQDIVGRNRDSVFELLPRVGVFAVGVVVREGVHELVRGVVGRVGQQTAKPAGLVFGRVVDVVVQPLRRHFAFGSRVTVKPVRVVRPNLGALRNIGGFEVGGHHIGRRRFHVVAQLAMHAPDERRTDRAVGAVRPTRLSADRREDRDGVGVAVEAVVALRANVGAPGTACRLHGGSVQRSTHGVGLFERIGFHHQRRHDLEIVVERRADRVRRERRNRILASFGRHKRLAVHRGVDRLTNHAGPQVLQRVRVEAVGTISEHAHHVVLQPLLRPGGVRDFIIVAGHDARVAVLLGRIHLAQKFGDDPRAARRENDIAFARVHETPRHHHLHFLGGELAHQVFGVGLREFGVADVVGVADLPLRHRTDLRWWCRLRRRMWRRRKRTGMWLRQRSWQLIRERSRKDAGRRQAFDVLGVQRCRRRTQHGADRRPHLVAFRDRAVAAEAHGNCAGCGINGRRTSLQDVDSAKCLVDAFFDLLPRPRVHGHVMTRPGKAQRRRFLVLVSGRNLEGVRQAHLGVLRGTAVVDSESGRIVGQRRRVCRVDGNDARRFRRDRDRRL